MSVEWKTIENGKYKISDSGLVFNIGKNCYVGSLSPTDYIVLGFDDKTTIRRCRLVYETFIGPIPEGYEIHHKNRIRYDDRIENIEALSIKEHKEKHKNDYNRKVQKKSDTYSKKRIIQYSKYGSKIIREWKSAIEISAVIGFNMSHIIHCCQGKQKRAYDYIWKFK